MAHSTVPEIMMNAPTRRMNRLQVQGRPLAPQSPAVPASLAVDEEPDRLRRPDLRTAAARSARGRAVARRVRRSSALLSGVVYLVNDVADRDADRRHPTKRFRPIASGAVRTGTALGFAVCLTVGRARRGLAAAAGVWRDGGRYVGLLALYSGPLKHVVIIDVLTIAIGFVLRAVGGAVAIDVPISHWLLILTILLALFLALAKRRHELVLLADGATSHRPILEEYSPYLLDQMIAVVTASTLISYVIYTVSPETVQKFHTDWLGLTLPFPLYGIFRYLYLVHLKEGGGSPSDMLLNDRPLLVCVALWAITVAVIIYGASTGLPHA